MAKPKLTFLTELEGNVLQALFAVPEITELENLEATISLGILDMSKERAEVVQRLNASGIPVIAWLLLPKEQGHWMNADNADLAFGRYKDFIAWSKQYGLQWARIALDIQPDISFIQQLENLNANRWRLLEKLIVKAYNHRQHRKAKETYKALVDLIHADGYMVDSYQFPSIFDERKSHTTLLQRATGMVDVPADREVAIIYSSFVRPYGPGFIWSYGDEAQAIALGSTGGGLDLGPWEASPLRWEEFARDLRYAYVFTNDIHIFSLEGCVRQGFLGRLKEFNWDQPIIDPVEMSDKVTAWRGALQAALWIGSHPIPIGLGIAFFVLLLRWLFRKKPKAADLPPCEC